MQAILSEIERQKNCLTHLKQQLASIKEGQTSKSCLTDIKRLLDNCKKFTKSALFVCEISATTGCESLKVITNSMLEGTLLIQRLEVDADALLFDYDNFDESLADTVLISSTDQENLAESILVSSVENESLADTEQMTSSDDVSNFCMQ